MSDTLTLFGKTFVEYLTAGTIQAKVSEMAAAIASDYSDEPMPLFVSVLSGSLYFTADLTRQLPVDVSLTFIRASSYEGMKPTGDLKIKPVNDLDLRGRDVLILEDIVDTGNTLKNVKEYLKSKGAGRQITAALLFKPQSCIHSFRPDYAGFEIPDQFMVGYGMDFDQAGRNLPSIYRLSTEKNV